MRLLFVASRLHPNYTDSLRAFAAKHELEILVAWQAENERHEGLSLSNFPDGLISRLMKSFYRRAGIAPEQIAYRKRHPSLLWLMSFIRKHHIDTVYARRDNKHLLRTARLAARLTRCQFVTYRQEIFDPDKEMDSVAIYPLSAALVRSEPPANFIPLAIDLTRIPKPVPVPQYVAGSGEPLRIIAVGKLIERKGHQLLIEAAAMLRDRLPLQVSIYGAYSTFHAKEWGQQIAEMVAACDLQDCVTLMPNITPKVMLDEYKRHHLFVYSGWVGRERDLGSETYVRANGQCGTCLNSLIEAMAVGLPIICAAEKHVLGSVENGGNGLVFQKGDAADLAAKIETIATMDLASMGRRSRSLIETYHNAKDFPVRFEWLVNSLGM